MALRKYFLFFVLILIVSCIQTKDFNYGIKEINNINLKYNTTYDTYPKTVQKIELLINDLKELKKLQMEEGQEPFYYAVNYRILNLEAEKLYIEGQKYRGAGTTKDGFGCKSMPLIIESVALRNSSALKGFEAVNLLREFVNKYTDEANSIGLSEKNALFLNATFYQISKDARSDSSTINHFCPQNVTLELYQTEIRKRTNLTEDYINNLDYDTAVKIWKKIRGIN